MLNTIHSPPIPENPGPNNNQLVVTVRNTRENNVSRYLKDIQTAAVAYQQIPAAYPRLSFLMLRRCGKC